MSFFEFLQWRTAPLSVRQRVAVWGHIALWAGCCQTGMAQTAAPAQEAIKKALQSGQLDQAAKLVQQERERAPKDVQMRFMEGVIQAQQGQTEKAIETFRQITQSQPELSEAYNNLGVLYAAKGRLEESKTYLEKALQTHPSYAAAHRNLSDVHSQLAKQNYAKALQVEPKLKQSPPQLTLLGSIAQDKRLQPPSTASTAIAANQPPASSLTPSVPTAPSAPAVAAAAASAPVANAKPLSVPPAAVGTAAAPVRPAVVAAATPPTAQTPKPAAPPAAAPAKSAGNLATATSTAGPGSSASASASAAPAAAAKPADNAGKDDQAAVKSAVTAWARAWSQKDMPKYLAAYAESFTPAEKMSRAKWESDRRARIVSKKTIAVGIHQLQITLHGNKATVKFQQIYESDNFKGNSRKVLEMHKQGHQWLIVRETVN